MEELSSERVLSIRFTYPTLYKKMMEVFKEYKIHPYDVQCVIFTKEDGYLLQLRQAGSPFVFAEKDLRTEQVIAPDDELIQFFEEAAKKCQQQMISHYYRMIKQ